MVRRVCGVVPDIPPSFSCRRATSDTLGVSPSRAGPSTRRDGESRRQYGLDQPLYVQYASWGRRLPRGDFGIRRVEKPVGELIASRLGFTLCYPACIIVCAVASRSAFIPPPTSIRGDVGSPTLGFLGLSVPDFMLGWCTCSSASSCPRRGGGSSRPNWRINRGPGGKTA